VTGPIDRHVTLLPHATGFASTRQAGREAVPLAFPIGRILLD